MKTTVYPGTSLSLAFLTFVAMTLLLSSCKKKEQTNFYISVEYKGWSCYKTGSYWVYLNEKTGTQDCTWVKTDTNYIQIHHGDEEDPVRYYEIFRTEVSGDLYTGYYTEASGDEYTSVNLVPTYLKDISFSLSLLQNPNFRHTIYHETIENAGVADVYQEETVNGHSFSNVYDIRHEWFSQYLNSLGDSLIASIHLVKNIGIIKLRKYKEGADTTWSLLRWKVVQ